MPTCPECGHTQASNDDWIATAEAEYSPAEFAAPINGSASGTYVLVVCPGCDAVLGGGGYSWAHDA